jgi:hypothetical protein
MYQPILISALVTMNYIKDHVADIEMMLNLIGSVLLFLLVTNSQSINMKAKCLARWKTPSIPNRAQFKYREKDLFKGYSMMPSPLGTNCRNRRVVPPSAGRSLGQSHCHPRATRRRELGQVELEVEGVRPKTLDEVEGVQVVVAEVVVVDVVGDGDVAAVLIAADRPFG